jgi:hypothetical protein
MTRFLASLLLCALAIAPGELAQPTQSAVEARLGGVTLFTTARHTAAAGLSFSGKIYRAASGDDAAFHQGFKDFLQSRAAPAPE